jgi:hypothetical protein
MNVTSFFFDYNDLIMQYVRWIVLFTDYQIVVLQLV